MFLPLCDIGVWWSDLVDSEEIKISFDIGHASTSDKDYQVAFTVRDGFLYRGDPTAGVWNPVCCRKLSSTEELMGYVATYPPNPQTTSAGAAYVAEVYGKYKTAALPHARQEAHASIDKCTNPLLLRRIAAIMRGE